MSSFANKGLRKNKLAHNKKVNGHVKAFYHILGEMDELAKKLDPTIEYTEENINEYTAKYYGRELDGMEKMLVLGKLHHVKEELKNETEDNT